MIMNKKNPEWTETINYNALEDKIDKKKIKDNPVNKKRCWTSCSFIMNNSVQIK